MSSRNKKHKLSSVSSIFKVVTTHFKRAQTDVKTLGTSKHTRTNHYQAKHCF